MMRWVDAAAAGQFQTASRTASKFTLRGAILSIWCYRIIRVILSAVFLWSGVVKLLGPRSFAPVIESFGLVPPGWVGLVAVTIPALELIAGLGLLLDFRGSLAGVGALLTLFAAVLSYGIWMGLDIDCGCFGPGDPEAEAYHGLPSALYRDLVMLLGVFYLYLWRFYRSSHPAGIRQHIQQIWKGGKR